MKDNLLNINSIGIISELKKRGIFNPLTARILLSAQFSKDPTKELRQLESIMKVSQLFRGPFMIPDSRTNGLINFALTEQNLPVGINPDECHFLIAGQTGSGKSTLLKIIFSQALLINKWR